jgi:hypothetical protein
MTKVRINLVGGGSMNGEIDMKELESGAEFILFIQPSGKEVRLNRSAIAYLSEDI